MNAFSCERIARTFCVPLAMFAGGLVSLTEASAVNYEMVTVGDPGNADDTTGYGGVAYEYRIGKYEVTIGQYVEFLNAVAKSDPYDLYNTNMETDLNVAGIVRTGSSGAYIYSVMNNSGDSANRPIAYVSWLDAARFANWMQNGQGSANTETGAYTLNGAMSGTAPPRNPGAQFFVPTEDEWFKAAYYKGGGTNAGYWVFATQSDTAPGNMVGGEPNQANYYAGGWYSEGTFSTGGSLDNSDQNYLTDVGAFTASPSAYGTFDQGGNVSEWHDLDGEPNEWRGARGGGWHTVEFQFTSSSLFRPDYPIGTELSIHGFRLAAVAVPEPSTWLMAAGGLACATWGAWRRRRRPCSPRCFPGRSVHPRRTPAFSIWLHA